MKQIYKTKQDCLLPALECLSKSEFAKKFPGAVAKAQKEGWYTEITSHLKHPKIKWTKEATQEVAKRYKTKTEFRQHHKGCYDIAYRNKWLDDICTHMIHPTKPRKYYTKERCAQLALECKSRSEFRQRYDSAYQRAYKQKWLDEICSHMLPLNDKKFRDIYVIKNDEYKYVYVGLSCNVQKRYVRHLSKPSTKVKQLLSISHSLEILETHLPIDIAIKKEQEYIDKFKAEGWKIFNSVKAGSIGNPYESKWDIEEIKLLVQKYNSRMKFYRENPGVFDFLYNKKLLEQVMKDIPKSNDIVRVCLKGEELSLTEISKKYNVSRIMLYKRYKKGVRGDDLILPSKLNQYI